MLLFVALLFLSNPLDGVISKPSSYAIGSRAVFGRSGVSCTFFSSLQPEDGLVWSETLEFLVAAKALFPNELKSTKSAKSGSGEKASVSDPRILGEVKLREAELGLVVLAGGSTGPAPLRGANPYSLPLLRGDVVFSKEYSGLV